MKNDYILIVGGAGYIGSHVAKESHKKGYRPIIYDNLVYGHKELVKWGDFVRGDLADIEQLRSVFKRFPIRAVMHFSAYAYVGESVENPAKYYLNNVANTIYLLNVMREFGVKYFIFSSTCATYGYPIEIPITEKHVQEPVNPYGRSKLMVEWILSDFSAAYDLKYVSLRYFNAAGADPDIEIGEWHEPETHLIPLVLDVAIGKSDHIKIFGTDYNTADGTCIRDYIHVTDLASAHMLALEYLFKGGRSDVFNLGNGEGFSVKAVIKTAAKVTGKKIKAAEWHRRPGDPDVLVGDCAKVKNILKWEQQYNDLPTIIRTAWQLHKKLRQTP
ncbi:UDP-glucose 4-epimerase GalE [Desulfobacteraceae bacterium SEEP-SAG9]|nr:UDP-glucose 4-epimerase GalE [Desulfobacteraceae bacterium SEEP-SAG9]